MSGKFNTPITKTDAPSWYNPWSAYSDWIDISEVGDNEINMLVSDCAGAGIAFAVTTVSGTYTIDWGDGVIESGRTSGVTYEHQYVIGNGTICSLGYTTFKIRIYGASSDITRFQFKKYSYTSYGICSIPVLWMVFGTTKITSYYQMCGNSGTQTICLYQLQSVTIPSFESCTTTAEAFYLCPALYTVVLPDSWGLVTTCQNMFYNCDSLISVKFPTSWGSMNNCSYLFTRCESLSNIKLPDSWGSISTCSYMFNGCVALPTIELPEDWDGITTTSYMFNGCTSLSHVVLPSVMGSISTCQNMFTWCSSLRVVENIEFLGSMSVQCDFRFMNYMSIGPIQNIVIPSLVSGLIINFYGTTGNIQITSIRLTNPGSTFTNGISITYCSLDETALNTLFGDLPTVTSEIINITGNPGAATCTRSIATAKGWTVTG